MVGPAWPRKEHTGLLSVVRSQTASCWVNFRTPEGVFNGWNGGTVTPIGHVTASDVQRYTIVQRGLRPGLVDTIDEAGISRHHDGEVVSNGAMGVPKLKRLLDNSTVELQRCISNFVPMNANFRRLRGDPSLLPPVFHLRIFVLDGVCR